MLGNETDAYYVNEKNPNGKFLRRLEFSLMLPHFRWFGVVLVSHLKCTSALFIKIVIKAV